MIRVIALDLDGTLLTSNKKVSMRTNNVLKRYARKGYKIVIATGRSPQSVAHLLSELESEIQICYNGAVIYENENKIYENLISSVSLLKMISWFELNYPDLIVVVESDGKLYSNKFIDGLKNYQVIDLKEICLNSAARIIIKVDEVEDIDLVYKNLPSDCKMVITDHGVFAEIMPRLVSKAEALKYMLEKWNLSFENVIAFGDDMNDVEILKESKIGVAMGNAHSEVKKIAKVIVKSNDEDGIAEYLEQICI